MQPSESELQAYGRGELNPQQAAEVEAYVAAHPECWQVLDVAPDDEVIRNVRGARALPGLLARSPLLRLAVGAVVPILGGCAAALIGGEAGGLAGVVAGQAVEKAINFFGEAIVKGWWVWMQGRPPAERQAALVELGEVAPEVARREVAAMLEAQAPHSSEADRQVALDYLSAIPRSVRQSLLSDRSGGRTLSPAVSVDGSWNLLPLLPASLPPYVAPCVLPGTTYRLEELIGTGGFGAVYRAVNPDMQLLPLAIKICLDRSLVEVLRREKDNLERLIREGGQSWSPRIVRLYGYNLEHERPYLVYEYLPGGDLVEWLARRRARTGKGLTPQEVLGVIVQVVEALAFAHERGIVHRDLKPANVLIEDETGKVKLADFGIGGAAVRAAQRGRMGAGALSAAEQASLFRGAGTPLYVDPEQREGKAPDPRHDLHSLGVTWYQLLVGDVRREMPRGWARELERGFSVPRDQVEMIERCVGWIEERPRDAGELLSLLRGAQTSAAGEPPRGASSRVETPSPLRSDEAAIPPSSADAPSSAPSQTEAEAWTRADKAGTSEAMSEFLREWPAGGNATVARGRLANFVRAELAKDLSSADLRRRYLEYRTEEQRIEDGTSDKKYDHARLTVAFVSFFVSVILSGAVITTFDLKGSDRAWCWLLMLVGPVAGYGITQELQRRRWYDPIARELGPLPPDTPRDLAAARRFLLGDEQPIANPARRGDDG